MVFLDPKLKQDLEHMFSVFRNNTEYDLRRLLPLTSQTLKYKKELESELESFKISVMNRLSEEFTR